LPALKRKQISSLRKSMRKVELVLQFPLKDSQRAPNYDGAGKERFVNRDALRQRSR
jgi:hypothetical protein